MVPYTSISCRRPTFDEEREDSKAQLKELSQRLESFNQRFAARKVARQDRQRAATSR